jgi:hypothetical protein
MEAVPDLVKAIFERGNSTQSYWSFYSKPPEPGEIIRGHIAADLGVLAAIWLLTLWPRETRKEL